MLRFKKKRSIINQTPLKQTLYWQNLKEFFFFFFVALAGQNNDKITNFIGDWRGFLET